MKIVCLGDSLTYGYGIHPYEEKKAWPFLLEEKSDATVMNEGIPGIGLLSENGYWNSDVYLHAVKKKPDACILWIGENDSNEDLWDQQKFQRGYALMVEELLEHVTRDHLLLIRPLFPREDVEKAVYDYGIQKKQLKVIDDVIQETAGSFGVESLDLNPSFEGHAALYSDDVHPNAAGNQLIGKAVYQKIKEMHWCN